MKNQLKDYIRQELKKLKYRGDVVELKNVYPSLLEDVIGNFTPYDLNGYDCDYWATYGSYEISGCMRFGTAEIKLTRGKEKPKEEEVKVEVEEKKEPIILRLNDVSKEDLEGLNTYYFTFGGRQRHEGHYQPIMAKDSKIAGDKMREIYGREWAFDYDEEEWFGSAGMCYANKGLELIIAL